MNPPYKFVEPPRLEWHARRPFVIARLPAEFAKTLTSVALEREKQITQLAVTRGWEGMAEANPTTARYSKYNVFLLDPRCLPLYFALRSMYRFMLETTGNPNTPRVIQGWCNVHRKGQHLHRHEHDATYIASFAAFAEGSTTSYGPFPVHTEHDHPFEQRDGQLIMTEGPRNFHEVSVWQREDSPRVTYAFDIYDADHWDTKHVLLPFDADEFPYPSPNSASTQKE